MRQAVVGIALALALATVSPGRADAAYSASVGSYSLSSSTTLSAPLVVTNGSSATYVLLAHNWSTFKTSLLVGLPGSSPATLDLGALEIGSAFDAAMTTDGKVVVAYERRSYTPARLYVAVASNGSFGSPTRIDVSAGSAASVPRVVAVSSGGAVAMFVQAESGSQTLFSAEYRQGAWLSTTTVADLGTAGTIGASAIDLAAGGGAAIAVFPKAVATTVTLTGSGTTTLRAHAARWNGSWGAATQIDGAAGAGALAGAAIAMNSAGDGVAAVRLANGSTSTVAAARYASGWAGAAVVATGDILGAPRVGVATNGNAQLAFSEATLGHAVLRAARWDGAQWSAPVAIDGPDDTSAFDLAVAADGVAWVVYRGSNFYVNRFDGASWQGYEYVYSGTSAGTPSAAISGTNGLLAAWSAGSTMRVASVGVAAPTVADAGSTGDAASVGGSGSSGGSGGAAGAAAPTAPGEGSADAGADTRSSADAGAAAIDEDAGASSSGGDAGITTLAPTGNSSDPYDAGTATVATSARCAADADCGVGETCDTSVGVCVAATAIASANVAAGLSCQADLDCASGSACVSGQCVATIDILRGCGCAVTEATTVSPLSALALLALAAISFARFRRRYGVKPRP
jgi:MYXO-CTERM domain-containing protein